MDDKHDGHIQSGGAWEVAPGKSFQMKIMDTDRKSDPPCMKSPRSSPVLSLWPPAGILQGFEDRIKPFYEIYILYNAYDDDFVTKILRPKLTGMQFGERYVTHPCRIRPTDTLYTWHDIPVHVPLRDRHDLQKVIVVLSDRYLQVIGQSSEYKSQSNSPNLWRVKEIHRCHGTLNMIQLGEITSDGLDELLGQAPPKINWFTWPKQEDESLGFWRIFAFHINP